MQIHASWISYCPKLQICIDLSSCYQFLSFKNSSNWVNLVYLLFFHFIIPSDWLLCYFEWLSARELWRKKNLNLYSNIWDNLKNKIISKYNLDNLGKIRAKMYQPLFSKHPLLDCTSIPFYKLLSLPSPKEANKIHSIPLQCRGLDFACPYGGNGSDNGNQKGRFRSKQNYTITFQEN